MIITTISIPEFLQILATHQVADAIAQSVSGR